MTRKAVSENRPCRLICLCLLLACAYCTGSSDSSLSMHPPDRGKAVGYNPDDFTATGPDLDSGVARGMAQLAVATLAERACPDGSSPYVVVETANPRGMEAIKGELELQKDPAFDPDSRVTPRLIAATHLVKGSFTIEDGRATANLRIEDLSGNVIARATADAPAQRFFEAVESAAKALAAELCAKEQQPGKKLNLDRYQEMNQALRQEQQLREQHAQTRVNQYANSIR